MKLYEAIVTKKAKPSDTNDVPKQRPILVIADTVAGAKKKIVQYWGKEYKVGTPNMIVDFHPR